MTEIRQIVYMSTASPKFSPSEINRILHLSRARNKSRNVTGLLVYGDGNVIQAIEGPSDQVGALFGSISKDARHKDIIKVVDITAEKRDFPNWQMAFARAPDKESVKECVDLLSSKQQLVQDLSGLGIVGSILRGFVERIVVG